MAARQTLARPVSHIVGVTLATVVAAVILLFVPGPAGAAPPTLNSVTQTGGVVTIDWTLAPGTFTKAVAINETNSPHDFFGFFGGRGYSWDTTVGGIQPNATSFSTPYAIDAGTWFVRVASNDGTMFGTREWSNILSITIKPVCSDGLDNDSDGKTDYPGDPGCFTAEESNETDPPAAPAPKAPASASVAARRVDGISRVRRRGVTVGFVCPRACTASSKLLLLSRRPATSATPVVGRASQSMSDSGYATFRVPLSARGKRKLEGAKSAKLSLVTKLIAADGAGLGTITRTVRLVSSTPVNRAPEFGSSVATTRESTFIYDDDGRLFGGYTLLTVTSLPTDPDGDPLTYSWTGPEGLVTAKGPSVLWTRTMDMGQFRAGTLMITVSDGRGGSDQFSFIFNRGAS